VQDIQRTATDACAVLLRQFRGILKNVFPLVAAETRAKHGRPEDLRDILAQVPDAPPLPGDEL
jgi:hypothetical protein